MKTILQRYYDYLCGEHTRQNTIKNKYAAAKILHEHIQGEYTETTMLEFKTWSNIHYKHNSRNNRINAWNQFLRWNGHPELQMKQCGFIDTNQYALTEEELDRLLEKTKDRPMDHIILLFLFDGALRPSEIIDIRINRRDGNLLYLDETKTGDKRIILSPMLQDAWEEYLLYRPEPKPGHEDYLLLKKGYKEEGQHFKDRGTIHDIIQSLGEETGLTKHITPYTIRRTSATLRLNKYSKYDMGNPKLVQRLFRHTQFETTMRYDRTEDEDIQRYFHETQGTPHKQPTNPHKQLTTPHSSKTGLHVDKSYDSLQTSFYQEDDNSCFSFSFSLFNESIISGMTGSIEPDLRLGWSKLSTKEVFH